MRVSVITLIVFFGLLSRIIISIWNGFFGPSYGAELDAQSFHQAAVDIATSSTYFEFEIGHIYSWWLAFWYKIFTPSLFLGSILSVFVWLGSAYLLSNILSLVKASKKIKIMAMVIFSFWPSSLIFTSVTLRESYQLFFITVVFYSALKIYLKGNQAYWIYLVAGVFGAGVLHGGLLAAGLCIIVLTMFYMQKSKGTAGLLLKYILAIPVLIPLIFLGSELFSAESYDLSGGIAQSVESYQLGGMKADTIGRADYRSNINIVGTVDFLLFYPIALFQYLFEPMPWKASSAVDVFTLIENICRAIIFIGAYRAYKVSSGDERKVLIFSMLCLLVIESIWALGTKNWGTAVRHHIPSLVILVALQALSRKCITAKAAK